MANLSQTMGFMGPLRVLGAAVAVFLTTGCAKDWVLFPPLDPNESAQVAATDPIALRLAESADKAAVALQDLARVEQTRRPPAPEPAALPHVDELQQLVTVNWVGPVEPLVRNLAERLKYDVVVVGTQPMVPVVVRISQVDRTVVEALRNLGEQATEFLDLVVNPQSRKLEIRYKRGEVQKS